MRLPLLGFGGGGRAGRTGCALGRRSKCPRVEEARRLNCHFSWVSQLSSPVVSQCKRLHSRLTSTASQCAWDLCGAPMALPQCTTRRIAFFSRFLNSLVCRVPVSVRVASSPQRVNGINGRSPVATYFRYRRGCCCVASPPVAPCARRHLPLDDHRRSPMVRSETSRTAPACATHAFPYACWPIAC